MLGHRSNDVTNTAPGRRRVLAIDDEADILELLRHSLTEAGYDVRTAETGADGLREVETFAPDVVLLDLMLPDLSGIEVCRRIRAANTDPRPALIVLSAKADEIDRVVAFEIGADDYVVKPFSMRELLLRVRARLQSQIPAASQSGHGSKRDEGLLKIAIGPMRLDLEGHRLTVNGKDVPVTPIEMRLLAHFAQANGRVCTREDLLTHVWRYEAKSPSRTVDTYIKRLREKLGAAGQLIQTVRGMGYRLADPYDPADTR